MYPSQTPPQCTHVLGPAYGLEGIGAPSSSKIEHFPVRIIWKGAVFGLSYTSLHTTLRTDRKMVQFGEFKELCGQASSYALCNLFYIQVSQIDFHAFSVPFIRLHTWPRLITLFSSSSENPQIPLETRASAPLHQWESTLNVASTNCTLC